MNGWIRKAKQRCFPKGVRRTANNYLNRLIRRATRKSLSKTFSKLGIHSGAVVCVHSALSTIGYLVDGPEGVIFALQDAIPDCTIMMPSFPFGETALKYVSAKPIYDPVRMPSESGLLTESMRRIPTTRRSLHPTHPCIALGPLADELIENSEFSPTPFGDSSTYGRFSNRSDAVLLLIHTNNTSIVHRFQEIVDMPNLFLPDLYQVRGLDNAGTVRSYSVRIHNPFLPLFVAIANNGGQPEYMWFPDYVVQFPIPHETRIFHRVMNDEAKQFLRRRQQFFDSNGIFRRARHGQTEVMAIRVKSWQERICEDLRKSIAQFPEAYRLQNLRDAKEKGRLTH